jgi:hypothetical protein
MLTQSQVKKIRAKLSRIRQLGEQALDSAGMTSWYSVTTSTLP